MTQLRGCHCVERVLFLCLGATAVLGHFHATPKVVVNERVCKAVRMLEKVRGKALKENVLDSFLVGNEDVCQLKCIEHDYCLSYNLGPKKNDRHLCEISSSDAIKSPHLIEQREGFIYQGTKNPCSVANCLQNQSCLPLFGSNSYQCVCPVGYHGDNCEQDIDECDTSGGIYNCAINSVCTNSVGSYTCSCKTGFFGSGKTCSDINECESSESNICHVNATCTNTEGSYSCSCKNGLNGDGVSTCKRVHSCAEIAEINSSAGDGKYTLTGENGESIEVFCLMSSTTCSGRGWNLVMRINTGSSSQFKYDSAFWSDKNAFQPDAANGLHDSRETKTAAYWLTPFTKICLGMKTDQERFIEVSYNGSSLYSVISSGDYASTDASKATWLNLVDRGLQNNCNKQGFNVQVKVGRVGLVNARIGIYSNNQNNCNSCDSWITFGGISSGCSYKPGFSYVVAANSPCYILVK